MSSRELGRVLGVISFLTVYASGGLAVVLVASFGPLIARGLQFLLATNVEPRLASLPYPWLPTLLAIFLPWPVAFSGRLRSATLAALPLLLVPAWQLVRLYEASA